MSNVVDILLVDGDAHGMIINAPRPVTSNQTVNKDGTELIYVHRVHTYFGTEDKYHVALPADSEVTDDFIDGLIFISVFPPAWDLNPPYTQMLIPTI